MGVFTLRVHFGFGFGFGFEREVKNYSKELNYELDRYDRESVIIYFKACM